MSEHILDSLGRIEFVDGERARENSATQDTSAVEEPHIVKQWRMSGENMSVLAYIDSLRDAKYGLNPTPEMIDAGAQRLVRWETGNEKWPDDWDALHVHAARNEAERVWRSMWLAAPRKAGNSEPASLTHNVALGAALWLGTRCVARIVADVKASTVTADDPEPQWHKDAMVFVNAVNALAAAREQAAQSEADYEGCRDTLRDERTVHAQVVQRLKNAASEEIQAANQRAAQSAARAERAERALCELTPGGSEYAGDVDACVRYIRDVRVSQHDAIVAATKRAKESAAECERVREDAERYRYLRDEGVNLQTAPRDCLLVYQGPDSDHSLLPDELDDAIDQALASREGKS